MKSKILSLFCAAVVLLSGCPRADNTEQVEIPLRIVPALKLNYRFESDVLEPKIESSVQEDDERNAGVQTDFDENRPKDLLDRTITAPDKNGVLAVFRQEGDLETEFRLDMYSPDGVLRKKITHEEMAVHFPGTIVWSPDSQTVGFIAMVRGTNDQFEEGDETEKANSDTEETPPASPDGEAESAGNPKDTDIDDPLAATSDVLTFRTEQIYTCDLNGGNVKPLTQKEGLIYFYAVWAPDSSAMVALAAPFTEWRIQRDRYITAGQVFVPSGRPRLIEKNGRERLLDDFLTPVQPVWSPDSAKVAVAFDKQIRIYDSSGENPTQAAIPLRNRFLIAAKDYEDKLMSEEESEASPDQSADALDNSNSAKTPVESEGKNTNANGAEDAGDSLKDRTTTLPDAEKLVSFNPIVRLFWEADTALFMETGYLKNFLDDEAQNRRSYVRWHLLTLSSQAFTAPAN